MRVAAVLVLVHAASSAVEHRVVSRTCACLRELDLGDNLGSAVKRRVRGILQDFYTRDFGARLGHCSDDCSETAAEALILDVYMGNISVELLPRELRLAAWTVRGLSGLSEASEDGSVPRGSAAESFVMASAVLVPGAKEIALFTDGLPAYGGPARRVYDGVGFGERARGIALGAVYGAYQLLERLGFAFLHPLGGPLRPVEAPLYERLLIDGIKVEGPRWPTRGMHYHTQHPLELTDALQGLDIPMGCSTSCVNGAETRPTRSGTACVPCTESFEAMLPKIETWFEWCAASFLNRVQWILLATSRMGDFVESELRQERFRRICATAHSFGLACGAVVPIADMQQHGWYMVNTYGKAEDMKIAIERRIDWVADAGFDFISTENGLSEFTHPDDALMLSLLDIFTNYTAETYGMETSIKVHCSSGQYSERYTDPRPGKKGKLNFNFLPTKADPRLAVMPHTVQPFSLDDIAPVYGNMNFSDMLEYTVYEMLEGNREIIWYGESAYWVSVDVDVPLFLPVYADRRIHDLRLLSNFEHTDPQHPPLSNWKPKDTLKSERHRGSSPYLHTPIHGQVTFSSGWEWGYYLNDLVAALGSWNPRNDAADDEKALISILKPRFEVAFGESIGSKIVEWIAHVAHEQVDLYIYTTTSVRRSAVENKDHPDPAYSYGRTDAETITMIPREAEQDLNRDEVHSLFQELDKEKNGRLTYKEVKEGMASLRKAGVIDKRLWASQLLAGADADENESVDEEEFWLMLSMPRSTGIGTLPTRDQSDALFRQLDRGSFISNSRNRRGPVQNDVSLTDATCGVDTGLDAPESSGDSSWSFSSSFLGVAGDGLLHYAELRAGMQALRKAGHISPRWWASQLLRSADKNGDSAIDKDEFFRILTPEPDPNKLMGLAYLSGFDTWAELPRYLGVHMTQGTKVMATDWNDDMYRYVVIQLEKMLNACKSWVSRFQRQILEPFEAFCDEYVCPAEDVKEEDVRDEHPQPDALASLSHMFDSIGGTDRCASQRRYIAELFAGVYITQLRTEHVLLLYKALAPKVKPSTKESLLAAGRAIIMKGQDVVNLLEKFVYRVPPARIASWRGTPEPTAYRFGYLWAVHSMYFWWRDQGRAEGRSAEARRSPCYLNRMDPSELALGLDRSLLERFKGIMNTMPRLAGLELQDCLAPPADGFNFPEDL